MIVAVRSSVKVVVCTPDARLFTHVDMCLSRHVGSSCELKMKYACSAATLRNDVSFHDLDVLFIDIALRDAECTELAEQYRKANPDYVLMLMIDKAEDALKGYPLKAFRCPSKGNLSAELEGCIPDLLNELGLNKDIVEFQVANRCYRVYTDEILYAESRNHRVFIHYRRSQWEPSYIFDSLTSVGQLLEPHGFRRIHQSYIINMKYLVDVNSAWAVMVNGRELPISHTVLQDIRIEFQTMKSNLNATTFVKSLRPNEQWE